MMASQAKVVCWLQRRGAVWLSVGAASMLSVWLLIGFTILGGSAMSTEPTTALWGDTTLGNRVSWPTGFDPNTIRAMPKYSPSGEHLAFTTDRGNLIVFNLATGSLVDVFAMLGDTRPNLGCVRYGWISDSVLFAALQWRETAEFDSAADEIPLNIPVGHEWRLIDVESGTTLTTASFADVPEFEFMGALTENDWIVRRPAEPDSVGRLWLYHPDEEVFDCVLMECRPDERFVSLPRMPWCMKVVGPPDANIWATPIDVVLVNLLSADEIAVKDVPPLPPSGPRLTADGRFLITSTYAAQDGRWCPLVIDTATNQRTPLPATESWKPTSLNESRGMLLVDMTTAVGPRAFVTSWAEVPLHSLIAP